MCGWSHGNGRSSQPWTGVAISELRLSDTTPSLKADKSKQELHRRCPLEAPKKKKKILINKIKIITIPNTKKKARKGNE